LGKDKSWLVYKGTTQINLLEFGKKIKLQGHQRSCYDSWSEKTFCVPFGFIMSR